MKKHPIQDIIVDRGIYRFNENKIVLKLLETSGLDLNDLARMDFTENDRAQFAQLIGYSVSGFGDLSYVSMDLANIADGMIDGDLSELEHRNLYLEGQLKKVKFHLKRLVPHIFPICEEDLE